MPIHGAWAHVVVVGIKVLEPTPAPHTAPRPSTVMRSAVALLSLVAAIVAEAPYNLPRPTPSFNYPAPAPLPQPLPAPQPAPQPDFNTGYNYQRPSIGPTYVQPAPQPVPIYSQPQPNYPSAPQPQPIPQPQPNLSYGSPQARPAPIPEPIRPLPAYVAPQPQPQPAQVYQAIQPAQYNQQQQYSQQGYSYQQPQARGQFTSQLPLQSQPLGSNAATSSFSSYQADSNQYSGAQGLSYSDALDSTVVGYVQNIIKENEQTSARNAGYLSLVSGVSLENARPSIEISSFVQNSPINQIPQANNQASSSSSFSSIGAGYSSPSGDYGLPTIIANSQPTPRFLPLTQPATSYGSPN